MSITQTATVSAPRHAARKWLAFLAATVLLWVLLFRGCVAVCDVPPRVVWSEASGTQAPETFRAMGFPTSNTIDRFDAPGGAAVGKLDRAVAMSLSEDHGEWVRVADTPETFVRRSDLTALPPANAADLLTAYAKLMRAHTKDDFLNASVKAGAGDDRVVFSLSMDDFNQYWTYTVSGDRVTPQKFEEMGKAEAFAAAPRFLVAGPCMLLLGVIGTWLLGRALLGKRRHNPAVG